MEIHFRPHLPLDIPVIHQFGLDHLGYDVPLTELASRLAQVHADPDHFFRIAEDELGTVLGMVHAYYMPLSMEPPQVVLYSLIVGSAARGRKLGQRLIAQVEDFARSRKAEILMVATNVERQAAIDFYQANGFKPQKLWSVMKKAISA